MRENSSMKKVIKEKVLPFFKRNMIIALILIMVFLSFAVADKNAETVDKLVLDTTTTFITVSVIKGAADMIEGSTLFGIEVGDVVQPVLDSVNVVWKFLLGALAFWGCMKLFITLPAVLAIALVILAVVAYLMNKGMSRFLMFCSFVCSLIPFIIFGTGVIMNFCTEPLREEAQEHFDRVAAAFAMDGLEREMVEEQKYEEGNEEHWYDWAVRPFKSATVIITQSKQNITYFTDKAKEILRRRNYIMSNLVNGTWKYVVVLIMNSILIPGLLFLFFYKLGKSVQPDDEKQILVQVPGAESEPKLLAAD